MQKSRQEILDDLLQRLQTSTSVTAADPGSIARTFIEVLTEEFYDFYNELDLNATMGFVSTASGRYLDLVGSLLDCIRNSGESDSNYRARITQQVYTVAGGNQASIRLKALAIDGVRDIVMRQYTNGAGSFTVHVITDDPTTPLSILNQVQTAVNDAKAYGVYAEVKSPVLIPMEIQVRLVFSSDAGVAQKTTIRQQVVKEIKDYCDSLILGDPFVINEVIQRAMDVSNSIQDIDIYSMKVDSASRFVGNVQTNWDERLVLDVLDII